MMLAPVRVTPPSMLPVSLAEAKAHLRVDHDEDDVVIEAYIAAAVDHLDGWTGILGRCLVEQTWQQDFEAACPVLLPLGPIIEVVSVSFTDAAGAPVTVDPEDYNLKVDAGGRARVEFASDVLLSGPIRITYKAGYPITTGDEPASTVPPAIKVAIMLMVGNWYENREAVSDKGLAELPFGASVLLAPYRRVGV